MSERNLDREVHIEYEGKALCGYPLKGTSIDRWKKHTKTTPKCVDCLTIFNLVSNARLRQYKIE